MLFEFSFTKLFVTLFILLLAWVIKWLYKSKQLQKFYINQGMKPMKREKNPNPDDSMYPNKMLAQQEPDRKGTVMPGPGGAFLLITDAEIIKEFLTHDNKYYRKSFKIPSTALLTSEGDLWKKHRKSVGAALQFGYYNSMMPTLISTIDEYIHFSQKKEITITAPDDFKVFVCDVLSRIFFGINPNEAKVAGKSPFLEALELSELTSKVYTNPLVWIFGEKARNLLFSVKGLTPRWRVLREHFMGEIKNKMQEIQKSSESTQETRKDLLHLLLDERTKFNNDPDKTLNDTEILDEYFSFLVGGKDTTGAFLAMFMYCYVTQSEWAQKLEQEIDNAVTNNNEITVDTIKSMDILTAFTKEVLRVYTPTPGTLPRIAKETHKLGDFEIKKGTMCMCVFGFNHFNPKYFENAMTFDPNRWLQKDQNEGSSFVYLPFSAGPRNCIGQNMALLIGKVLVTLIIKNFKVKLDPKYHLQMVSGAQGYAPKNSMQFTLSPK